LEDPSAELPSRGLLAVLHKQLAGPTSAIFTPAGRLTPTWSAVSRTGLQEVEGDQPVDTHDNDSTAMNDAANQQLVSAEEHAIAVEPMNKEYQNSKTQC